MSQSPAITGTEGERLDATVTVDSTFGSQQTQTIELRVEDFNSGTTVHTDSQQVTLQDSTDSQQITLSWPTSSGDAGTYDLVIESDQDTIQRLVEVTDTRIVDTFDDGDMSEYTDDSSGADWTVTTSPTFSGSHAATAGGSGDAAALSAPGDGLNYYPQNGDTVQFYALAGSSNSRVGVQLLADPSTDSGSASFATVGFGTAYTIELDNRTSSIKLVDQGAGGDSQTISGGVPTNEWLKVTVDFGGSTVTADIISTSSSFSESLSIAFSTEHGRAIALIDDGEEPHIDEVTAR